MPRCAATPFVKVNCAALPAELLESELFGFERGAFTGAIQHKPGQVRVRQPRHDVPRRDRRHGLAAAVQAAAGAAGRRVRAGSAAGRTSSVDVRVVAATNRDLEQAVADGQFREDLFFRLNVVCITLPPLRERRDEIPALTDYFLAQYSEQYNKPPLALATDTLRLFAEYDWPGNIRELENLIKRMVVLGTDTAIRREVAEAIAGRAVRVGPIPGAAADGEPPALSGAGRCRRPRRPRRRRAGAAGADRVAEGHRPPSRRAKPSAS